MRVGVDIDGVLADSISLWVHEMNRFFNKNKRIEDVHLFDIIQTFGITVDDLKKFIEQRGRFLMSAPCPVRGAAYYLSRIKEHHDIFIITARKETYKQETQDWLQRHNIPYDRLLLLGTYAKKEACLENGLSVMVEDTLEVARELSAAGIPVILMDAPYNRGNLPELICRKHSWFEIYQTLVEEPLQATVSCFSGNSGFGKTVIESL